MKFVICELPGKKDNWCWIDEEGFGSCGDAIYGRAGGLCLWADGPPREGQPPQDLSGDFSTQFPFPDAYPPDVLPEKGA